MFRPTPSTDLTELSSLITSLETTPRSLGPELTWFWLKDYQHFMKTYRPETVHGFVDFLDDSFDYNLDVEKQLDMDLIPAFLANPLYQHWKEDINWRMNG